MDSNPSAQFLLKIGEGYMIVVKTGEYRLSIDLAESKRIPIQMPTAPNCP